MKGKRFFLLFFYFLFCYQGFAINSIKKINADTLVSNIDTYKGQKVEIEGVITHICGVDSKKMKLKTEKGKIIKILAADSTGFSKIFTKEGLKSWVLHMNLLLKNLQLIKWTKIMICFATSIIHHVEIQLG